MIHSTDDDDDDDFSQFNRLPDEILLQILNKIIDFKTLCFCKLISTHFSSIAVQVDTISFTAPFTKPPSSFVSNTTGGFPSAFATLECDSFRSAVISLKKFKRVKSLRIELSSPPHEEECDRFLFKWKFLFGNRVESFVFLSTNSIYSNVNGNDQEVVEEEEEEEEDMELSKKKFVIACDCLQEAIARYMIMSNCTIDLPLLEKVSITDSDKTGRISLKGSEKIVELRNWMMRSPSRQSLSRCYVPVLKLPVSGYVMKGVNLVLVERNDLPDIFINTDLDDEFEDKEEAAYSEAVMEIFNKHRGRIERVDY